MSTKGIYTALSGAIAQSQRLDTIANNIANANTTAYKKDGQTFREFLTANERPPDVIQVPRVPASIESFYDMQGGDSGYVDSSETYTDFSQGSLKATGNNFDLALEGEGFFEVLSPTGVQLTRQGTFTLDAQGRLVTQNGNPVLKAGAPGEDINNRIIKFSGANVTVSFSGDVFEGGKDMGKLSVVQVDKKDALQKVGASRYQLKENYQASLTPAKVQVHQGYVETSNVNIIKEMTDMITASRTFESTQKAIKAFDEMNGRLVNDIPRLR
jgi:flagellar basal-body rod protein FlgF